MVPAPGDARSVLSNIVETETSGPKIYSAETCARSYKQYRAMKLGTRESNEQHQSALFIRQRHMPEATHSIEKGSQEDMNKRKKQSARSCGPAPQEMFATF